MGSANFLYPSPSRKAPLDDIAPAYRAACERWPDAPNLQQHYKDLARTYEENGSSLIELTKSFLEAVCWTVISELGAKPPDSSRPTTTELLSCVLDALGLRNQRGVGPLGKVISGYNKLAEGLNELRNQDGSVAHGKDGFLDAISSRHARVYLLSADSVIALILSAYDGKEPNLLTTREPPDRFRHLNERIDAGCALDAEVDIDEGVLVVRVLAGAQASDEAIELRVPPSELLYHLDRQAYLSVLEALREVPPPEREEETEPVVEEETEAAEVVTEREPMAPPEPAPEPSRLQLLDAYQGRYRDKATALYEFVIHNLLNGNDAQAQQVLRFVNTLLAEMEKLAVVDWPKRPSALAKVKVYLKRLITVADVEGVTIKQVQPLLEWLSREINSAGASQ